MKNFSKYGNYFAILWISIPIIYGLFFNNPIKREVEYLLSTDINWVIEAKYIDDNNKKLETIEYYDINEKKKNKLEMHFAFYANLYNYLQAGDTLIKAKGELLFHVKRGNESKSFLITPPEK
jgi:hypothetical protein